MVSGISVKISFRDIGADLFVIDAGAVSGYKPAIQLIGRQILLAVPVEESQSAADGRISIIRGRAGNLSRWVSTA